MVCSHLASREHVKKILRPVKWNIINLQSGECELFSHTTKQSKLKWRKTSAKWKKKKKNLRYLQIWWRRRRNEQWNERVMFKMFSFLSVQSWKRNIRDCSNELHTRQTHQKLFTLFDDSRFYGFAAIIPAQILRPLTINIGQKCAPVYQCLIIRVADKYSQDAWCQSLTLIPLITGNMETVCGSLKSRIYFIILREHNEAKSFPSPSTICGSNQTKRIKIKVHWHKWSNQDSWQPN